jgi:hypothetical protein
MANQDILTILEQRLGRRHARQRLGIEKDHEAQVFGQGINFFHFENLPLSHVLILLGNRLLLAQSRHAHCADECPLLGAKRTVTCFGGCGLNAHLLCGCG